MNGTKISEKFTFTNSLNWEYYKSFLKNFLSNVKRNIDLFFLALAIAFSNSFEIGVLKGGKTIEIRVEDFIISILIIVCVFHFLKSRKIEILKIRETPFFGIISLWLGVGFFSIVFNLFVGNYNFIKGIFYFLKEIEFFFIYFYVYWRVKTINSVKFILNLWILFVAISVAFIFFQIFGRIHFGEYCLAAISERGVFPTGAFFLIPFIFLSNILFYHTFNLNIPLIKKIFFGAIIFSFIFGVFGSGSKTNVVALFFSLLLTIVFLFLKTKNLKLTLIFLLAIFLIIIIIFSFSEKLRCATRINTILSPTTVADSYMKARWNSPIKQQLEKSLSQPPQALIFGLGKGYGEVHNQYLRNLVDVGIIGSIVFFILIFSIIKKTFQDFYKTKNPLSIGLLAGFLISTFAMIFMGFATEPFLVVKPSEVFWFFAAITMAALAIEKKQNLPQIYDKSAL